MSLSHFGTQFRNLFIKLLVILRWINTSCCSYILTIALKTDYKRLKTLETYCYYVDFYIFIYTKSESITFNEQIFIRFQWICWNISMWFKANVRRRQPIVRFNGQTQIRTHLYLTQNTLRAAIEGFLLFSVYLINFVDSILITSCVFYFYFFFHSSRQHWNDLITAWNQCNLLVSIVG